MKKIITIVVSCVAAMMMPSAAMASPIQLCEEEQSISAVNGPHLMNWDSWAKWFKQHWS
ncbi:hypothetical protein BBOMB_1488 [Bifidobacterium bombi DSM 19703]|uniref:Uncharacterized protein n=2 Tax=Bifidobacterium bombi TaxID=471511 RepID=A0A086BNV8_9BIFI|nr:hypothetical protein BBOMB_1488 [Bifidobacterium bombi DSM 19703]